MTEGEKRVRDLFEKFIAQKWEDVEKFMHPAFQSVHQDGARNKEEEIKLLKGLKIKDLNLGNFKVTQDESLMIVTYTVTAKEIIDGKSTLANPAQRLTVFIKSDGVWKWLAHANFIAITSKSK